MAFQYVPKKERFKEPGILESAGRNLVGSAANVVGLGSEGIGHLVGTAADEGYIPNPFGLTKSWAELNKGAGSWLSNWGQEVAQPAQLRQEWTNKGFLDRITNPNYWTDPLGAVADISSGLGSSLPFMGLGMGARAVGATLPVKQAINKGLFWLGNNGGKFGRTVSDFGRTNFGKALSETADAGLNYAATTAPMDAVTNAAEIIKPLKERGFSDKEIAQLMLGNMAEELPVDIAENFITGNTLLGKGFGLAGKTWKGRLGYGTANIPVEMMGEGVQEGYQTRATQKYQGLPYTESPIEHFMKTGEFWSTPEEKSAAASGAIGALLPAAGGTIYNTITGKDQKEQPQPEQNDAALRSWTGRNTDGVMSDDIHDMLVSAAKKYDLPVDRVLATAMAESQGNPYAKSDAGAIGIMQLMPSTARELGVDPYDVEENIDGGVRYLKQMYDEFGDWDLAHAAYNAGAGNVERYNGIPPFGETKDYVARINGFLSDYSPNYQGNDSSQGEEEQVSGGNIFGVENYDMPVAQMESTVEDLKAGWSEVIPQIGGVLKSMGFDPVLTSAARTREHQMRVNPNAPNSYHIIQDDGGDAIDISLTEGELTPEQEQDVLDYFKGTGLFNEVLYHSVVGGKHLHLGGLNVEKLKSMAPKSSKARATGATPNGEVDGEETGNEEVAATTPLPFSDIIQNILRDNSNAQFDMDANDEGTKNIFSEFATNKLNTATGEAALRLDNMFDSDGKFIQTAKNIKALKELFGDELQEFGQGKLNQRWSDLLKKSMTTPNFADNLSEDDRKFFGNIVKQKLKAAGVDLKGLGTTLAGLESGDKKTFENAWQAIQDKLKVSEPSGEPIISEKTQKALDDIAQRIDDLTMSNDGDQNQITAHSKLYRDIAKLNSEINKLTADKEKEQEKLSAPNVNQAMKVEVQGNVAKIDAAIKKKQADLDAKIDSFYNQPQSVEVKPINDVVSNELAALSQRKDELRATGGKANEISELNKRRDKIQNDNNVIVKLNQQAAAITEQIKSEPNAQKREALQDKLDDLNADIETKTAKLLNYINPPQPVKIEPSKRFAPVKAQAENAITKLDNQIETLKAQGVDEDSEELERLTDNKFAIQSLIEDLATLDAQAATAKKNQIAAEKANDVKAREKAKKQFNSTLNKYKKQEQALFNLLNPPQEETLQEQPFEPRNNGEERALEDIKQKKAQLRSEGGRYKEITDLNKRRDKIQRDSKEIAALEQQAADLEEQIKSEPNAQKREVLKDKLDKLNADIVDKDTKLYNYMYPPQKESPKTYEILPEVAKEISRLNKEILNLPDSESNDGTATVLQNRINTLKKLNNAVGQAEEQFNQAASELVATRQSGDKEAEAEAKVAFETAKNNLSAKQKELDTYLNPPVKEKAKPAQFEPVDEAVAQRVKDLNNQIDASTDLSTTNALSDTLKAIEKQNNIALKLKKQRDEQETIMNDTNKTDDERRAAKRKHADLSAQYDTAYAKLNEIMNPRNEDEEAAETFEPVSQEVKDALERLDNQINAETDTAKKEDLGRQKRELQRKNDRVASLQNEIEGLKDDLKRKQKGSKGYNKLQSKIDRKTEKELKPAQKALQAAVNKTKPKEEKKKGKKIYEATGAAKDKLVEIENEMSRLYNEDRKGNAEKISKLSELYEDIQGKVNDIGRLNELIEQKEIERDKAEEEGRKQDVSKLTGEISAKQIKLKEDEAKLDELLATDIDELLIEHAPPVDEKVAKAIAGLKQQIKKRESNKENANDLRETLRNIQSTNDEVARLRDKTKGVQLSSDIPALRAAEKKLAELVEPPKTESTETQREVTIQDKQALAEIEKLNNEINALKAEDEVINKQEIADKEKRRDSIQRTAQKIAELKAQIESGDKSTKTSDELEKKESTLEKLLEPKPSKNAGAVTTKVQQALKRLKEESSNLWSSITGKSEEDKAQIRVDIANVDKASKDLQTQNNVVAALQDKVGRIKAALDNAIARKDSEAEAKYNNLLNKYTNELEGEMAALTTMAEQHLSVKEETKKDTESETQLQEEPSEPLQVNANDYIQSALTPPVGGTDKAARTSRLEQAKKLRLLANQHGIEIPEALGKALGEGTMKAITAVQKLLLDSGKLFNTTQQQTQPPQQATNFDEDLKQAYQEISKDKAERKAQGNAILRVVDFSQRINNPQFQKRFGNIKLPKIDLPDGLAEKLQLGDEEAIIKAQEILSNAGLTIESNTSQETSGTESGTGLIGNTAEVITGSREAHQVRYKVVEASELNSSHEIVDNKIFANKEYPAELQPRDRERVDMQAQLISMGNKLNPADLLDARSVNQGAPVTRNDGVVLNGNGRTAAIRYAYENGKGEAYKKALIQNAERLGLNANEISKMNQPVLIRELIHSLTDEELRDLTGTQTGGAKMGASEQAQADAKKLSQKTLGLFPTGDNVDITKAESEEFLRSAISDIATKDELNSLTTKNGQINQDGINRVKRALFALAYDDNGIIARMSESVDSNIRGTINALLNAAPLIAKIKLAMGKGYVHNYDLKPITKAVNKLNALRNEGTSVSVYLQEQSLFSEHTDSEETREILSFLDANKHAPNKITAFFKRIAQRIQAQGDPREAGLFGEQEPTPLIDLIKLARQDIENSGMQDLFGQSETSSNKSAKPKADEKQPAVKTETEEDKTVEKDSRTLQEQVDHTVEGLKESISNLKKRGENISRLQDKLDKIEELQSLIDNHKNKINEVESEANTALQNKDYKKYMELKYKANWFRIKRANEIKELRRLTSAYEEKIPRTQDEIAVDDRRVLAELDKLHREIQGLIKKDKKTNEAEINEKISRYNKIYELAHAISILDEQLFSASDNGKLQEQINDKIQQLEQLLPAEEDEENIRIVPPKQKNKPVESKAEESFLTAQRKPPNPEDNKALQGIDAQKIFNDAANKHLDEVDNWDIATIQLASIIDSGVEIDNIDAGNRVNIKTANGYINISFDTDETEWIQGKGVRRLFTDAFVIRYLPERTPKVSGEELAIVLKAELEKLGLVVVDSRDTTNYPNIEPFDAELTIRTDNTKIKAPDNLKPKEKKQYRNKIIDEKRFVPAKALVKGLKAVIDAVESDGTSKTQSATTEEQKAQSTPKENAKPKATQEQQPTNETNLSTANDSTISTEPKAWQKETTKSEIANGEQTETEEPFFDDVPRPITAEQKEKWLAVKEKLRNSLYNKLPQIKEAIDIIISAHETLTGFISNFKPAHPTNVLNFLKRVKTKDIVSTEDEIYAYGADKMFFAYEAVRAEKYGVRNSIPKTILEKETALFTAYRNKTISGKELYQSIGKLLYPDNKAFMSPKEQAEYDSKQQKAVEKKQKKELKELEELEELKSKINDIVSLFPLTKEYCLYRADDIIKRYRMTFKDKVKELNGYIAQLTNDNLLKHEFNFTADKIMGDLSSKLQALRNEQDRLSDDAKKLNADSKEAKHLSHDKEKIKQDITNNIPERARLSKSVIALDKAFDYIDALKDDVAIGRIPPEQALKTLKDLGYEVPYLEQKNKSLPLTAKTESEEAQPLTVDSKSSTEDSKSKVSTGVASEAKSTLPRAKDVRLVTDKYLELKFDTPLSSEELEELKHIAYEYNGSFKDGDLGNLYGLYHFDFYVRGKNKLANAIDGFLQKAGQKPINTPKSDTAKSQSDSSTESKQVTPSTKSTKTVDKETRDTNETKSKSNPSTESEPAATPKQKVDAKPHKMPEKSKFVYPTLEEIKALINQAWDEPMRIALQELYDIAEEKIDPKPINNPAFTGTQNALLNAVAKTTALSTREYIFNRMLEIFQSRQAEEKALQETGQPPANIGDCKSIEDLSVFWHKKYNTRTSFASLLKLMDFDLVKDFISGVEQTLQLFPKTLQRVQGFGAGDLDVATSQAQTTVFNVSSQIVLNANDFSSKGHLMGKIRTPYTHKKATAFSLGVHEATHFLIYRLVARAGLVGVTEYAALVKFAEQEFVRWASELLSQNKKTPLDKAKLREAQKQLSLYAADKNEGIGETIAESLATINTLGEEAPPLAKAIQERLKEALKGDTFRNLLICSKSYSALPTCCQNNLSTPAVYQWYQTQIKGSKSSSDELRKQAENLLYDRGLAEELSKTKSRKSWEALLESRTPNETVIEQENWSDEKINEYAKDTTTANLIEQFGGTIKEGKVSFTDTASKNAFTRHIDLMIDPFPRFSLRGHGNTDIKNFVNPKDLTAQQKMIHRFGKAIGVRVVFFRNKNKNFHGVYAKGVTFLNVNSEMPLGKVFWHESMHWLTANNPQLYRQLVKAVGITDEQRRAYLNETGRTDLKTRAEIDEEILSDHFFDAAKRTGLLQSIAGKDRGLIERVVQWLKDTMNTFVEFFHNPQGKLTTSQAQAFAAEFGKICDKLVDENGRKIFRYNRRTGNIETRDGRRIETLQNFVDRQETFTDNEPDLSQKVFDKYLTDGIMKMVLDTVGEEIGKYIDVSKMSDPVAREEARDKLPYIKQLLTYYNLREVQDNEAYKNRLATKIEYARRCFDNDKRIRNESVRQMDGDQRQSGIREARTSTISKDNTQGTGRTFRGSNVGVSSSVSGGKIGARNHFLKLYDEIATKERSNRRGVFSSAKSSNASKVSRYDRRIGDNRTDTTFDEKALATEVEQAKREGAIKYSVENKNANQEIKFAGNGDLGRMFAAAKQISDKELTSQERKWVELGKSLGVQVKWIDAHTDLKGVLKDGAIYINRRANDSVAKTFYHELFHLTAALKPELYQDLMEYFTGSDAFTKEQLDAYRKETNRQDLSDAEAIEEILCDNFGQVQKRVQLMQEMSASNPSLAKRFVAWLKYMADKIASTFRNPAGGMTTAQRDAFIKGVSELEDKVASVKPTEHTGTKFSGSISNSVTKLRDKIKNIITATKNERPNKHMVNLLEKLSGYHIRTRHLADGIDILVKDVSKVIRTRRAYDWERILPEVGGLVAQKLNLNPSSDMKNYIASWLMDGEPNNTSQAAKDFQKAMRNADDIYRDQLLEVQGIFHEWNNRTADQIIHDKTSHDKETKPLSKAASDFLYKGYEEFIEELYPVQQLVEEIETDRGKKLKPEENPFIALRNYRGMAGRAKIMVEEDATAIEALKAAFPNINFDNFKTIRMILESIDALDNKENQIEFSEYVEACAVKDLHRHNADNLRQQYELRETIETLEDELDNLTDKGKIKAIEKSIENLKKKTEALKKDFYDTPYSEKVCDEKIAKHKGDKYERAQKELLNYSRTLLDIMVDSGILSEAQKIAYIKANPNYAPLFRKFDENEDVEFGDSSKERKGSSRDIISPLNSIIRNTYKIIKDAEKNKAKCLLANLARSGGAGTILDEVDDNQPKIGTVITFKEGGKKKYLETDKSIVKAVNNLTVPQMSWFMKLLRVGTMLLRNFATVYNPAFALRNLIMDNQNAMLYSKYGLFSPVDFVRGFLSVWNRDTDFQEWMAMGGAQASFWSVDRDYTEASLDKLRHGQWGQYKFKPWKLFSVLGEYSELGTRLGYFKKAKAELAKKNGGKIDRNILVEAALESRDLTDFARGGKSSRTWNSMSAFANASIQGWDKFFRTYDPRQFWSKDPEVKKQWERAMFRLAVGSILPAVLLFMMNHDDDWYKEDLPDWERQTHWCLGENIRIPKGQDVALRFFSNLTESMLRSMADNDPKAFKDWWKPAWDAVPDFIPTALQPIIECATNYDMFRKNAIVPMRQQRLPEYMQYDANTSGLAKAIGDSSLAKWIAGETGISPAKIDHFLYGYTGKLGKETLRVVESLNPWSDRNYNFKGISDVPLIGGFFRVPYRNPRILMEYYETLDEQTKLHNEFKLTKKRPEGYNHSLYTRIQKAQKEMQELTKKERKILDDTRLDTGERDDRQLAIQKRRVALAEKVLR